MPEIISAPTEITQRAWRLINFKNMNLKNNSPAKVDNFSRINKRKRVINPKECQLDMKDVLVEVFKAYHSAVKMFNEEIVNTPVQYRTRGMEASFFNSKLMQCIGRVFESELKCGKYGRRFLYKNGYIMLFKKLDSKGMPMNIKTKLSLSIENQLQGNLFNEEEDGSSPIIFFGYTKTRFGELRNPRVVYIDEGKKRWELDESMLEIPAQSSLDIVPPQPTGVVSVKSALKIKKKVE